VREYVLDFGGDREEFTLCLDCFDFYRHAEVRYDDDEDNEADDPCEPILVFVVEAAEDPK
jgi:hypothetical protein